MSNELDADLVPQVECSGCKKTFDWDLIESGTCPLCQPMAIIDLSMMITAIQSAKDATED